MDSKMKATGYSSKMSRDRGDAPARDPANNGSSSNRKGPPPPPATGGGGAAAAAADMSASTLARRAARRHKRAAAREKMGRPMMSTTAHDPALNSSWNSSSNHQMEYSDDDDTDDEIDRRTPGSFAVGGRSSQRSSQLHPAFDDETDNIAENTVVPEDDDNFKRATHSSSNKGGGGGGNTPLPVAYQAELVVDYPFFGNADVVVASQDKGTGAGATVPLKWLLIGVSIFSVSVVAIAVTLGLVLGGDDDGRGGSASDQAGVAPTFPPVVQPTFAPVIPPTFAPVVQPTWEPVVQPTFAPVAPGEPTFAPVVQPTLFPTGSPVDATTPSPTAEVTTEEPVPSPTDSTTEEPVSPTMEPASPTRAPVTPTDEPVAVVSPTRRPTAAPVNSGGGDSVNPIYVKDGYSCECRYYLQRITITDSNEWDFLTQTQFTAFLQFLNDQWGSFNPYPTNRRRSLQEQQPQRNSVLRGSRVEILVEEEGEDESFSRRLQQVASRFKLRSDSQDLFGDTNSPPFGMSVTYSYEFCVDQVEYLGDYFSAFVNHQSKEVNRNAQGSLLSLSSLSSVSAPRLQNKACSF